MEMTLHLGKVFYLELFSERATEARLHQFSCHGFFLEAFKDFYIKAIHTRVNGGYISV